MARKQTKAEALARFPIEQVMKLSGPSGRLELEGYVRLMRSSYKRRVQSFARKDLVSYAQRSFESSLPSKKPPALKKMTRNQLLYEYFRYAKFFSDETSTEKGIKKVNREQDIRIFGATKSGRPKRTMTRAERETYWDLYEEYVHQQPNATSRYGSNSIQQQLADAVFGNEQIDTENLVSFLDKLHTRIVNAKLKENLGSVPNVYSGRGINTKG